MTKCIIRMDRELLRAFVLEKRSSFFDEMAIFLNCKVVECKTAVRRSCQLTRRVIGVNMFSDDYAFGLKLTSCCQIITTE